jgi:hypothetical protein
MPLLLVMEKRWRLGCCILAMLSLFFHAKPVPAEEDETGDAKKTKAQNVGGLLFDVDEGVKIEQGPGGSVYLKSNREYMQEKFGQIDQRLADLEERMTQWESAKKSKASPGSVSQEEKESARQVLVS